VTHLSDDELARWRDGDMPTDAARVRSHLASCDSCRRRLADAVRSAPPPAPARFHAADFVGAGYGRYRGASTTRWRRYRIPILAAAAVLTVAFVLPIARVTAPGPGTPMVPADSTQRGMTLRLDAPSGSVAGVREFRWQSPVAAASYRVDVRSASGALVHTATVSGEGLRLDAATAAKFGPGAEYRWTVTALDDHGRTLVVSELRAFTVQNPR